MDVAERMNMIRLIEKIENNLEYSEKLGIKNVSEFRLEENEKSEREAKC